MTSSYADTSAALPTRRSSPFIDEHQRGSRLGQVLTGVVGIVLAVVLVVGQLSIAMTRGIEANLEANVQNIKDANVTLKDIVSKAAPTVVIEQVVAEQRATLGSTLQTMQVLNGEMEAIGASTRRLGTTVGGMQQTSVQLSSGVAGMDKDTRRVAALLKPLPAATDRTAAQLERIRTDSADINAELALIARAMQGYGLPQAKGVRG